MSGEKTDFKKTEWSPDGEFSDLDFTSSLAAQVSEIMDGQPDNATLARIGNKTERFALRPIWEKMDSPEKLFKDAAVCSLSRNQVKGGLEDKDELIENSIEDGECEDAAYGNGEENVFAVFDGVGGVVGGRTASHGCAENLTKVMQETDFTTKAGKTAVFNKLSSLINDGSTTGVIAKIVQDEYGKKLHYASVGDSKLYVVHRFIGAEQVNKDDSFSVDDIYRKYKGYKSRESIERLKEDALNGRFSKNKIDEEIQEMLTSYISNSIKNGERVKINAGNAGVVKLRKGDTIVLCTDGVTGDINPDIRDKNDIKKNVRHKDAQTAVKNLMKMASKKDDRTAIVINV